MERAKFTGQISIQMIRLLMATNCWIFRRVFQWGKWSSPFGEETFWINNTTLNWTHLVLLGGDDLLLLEQMLEWSFKLKIMLEKYSFERAKVSKVLIEEMFQVKKGETVAIHCGHRFRPQIGRSDCSSSLCSWRAFLW